ncbi:MAG: hypothetical protein OIF50_13050, partial [Flavobacteriaceae bacterium]|nr:hypothetical protein [Flavobacteriaceae bacterium]
ALTSGFQGGPWHVDVKKGIKLLTDPELFAPVQKMPDGDAKKLVQYYKDSYKEGKENGYKGSYNKYVKEMGWGAGLDIHKAIGKLPKPKKGWTLPGHKYTGPYNDLDSQVRYNPVTGAILEIYDQPTGKTDSIAMQHDVDYSVCKDDKKCKNEADRRMVKALDNVPYKERQWGHWSARNAINTRQKNWSWNSGKRKRPPSWQEQLAHELHKPIKRKFIRRRVIAKHIGQIWTSDLVDRQPLSKFNKGFKYLLMVIDVFSKYGWIRPLKDKKGETVTEALKQYSRKVESLNIYGPIKVKSSTTNIFKSFLINTR